MIEVTERAAKELRVRLLDETSDPEIGLRLLPAPGYFILALDAELAGDQVVEYQGAKVLFVGLEYYRILEGSTLDCQDTRTGPVLFVRL